MSPGWTSALDVGIAAPHAANAGEDCTESMRRRKRDVYARYLPALEAEGVRYTPMAWSCWGREHADTTAALTALARRAARRRGAASHQPLLREMRAHRRGHRPEGSGDAPCLPAWQRRLIQISAA